MEIVSYVFSYLISLLSWLAFSNFRDLPAQTQFFPRKNLSFIYRQYAHIIYYQVCSIIYLIISGPLREHWSALFWRTRVVACLKLVSTEKANNNDNTRYTRARSLLNCGNLTFFIRSDVVGVEVTCVSCLKAANCPAPWITVLLWRFQRRLENKASCSWVRRGFLVGSSRPIIMYSYCTYVH